MLFRTLFSALHLKENEDETEAPSKWTKQQQLRYATMTLMLLCITSKLFEEICSNGLNQVLYHCQGVEDCPVTSQVPSAILSLL